MLVAASLVVACVATMTEARLTVPQSPNGMPAEKWHYNFFGHAFSPLVLEGVNRVFIPVDFQAEGNAIYAVNLDSGFTNYTLSLNTISSNFTGPGLYSFDAATNHLYVTNSTNFICIDAVTGDKIWVTEAPSGVDHMGLGQVTVGGNGFVYYSGNGYTKNGVSQFTVLFANNGSIVHNDDLWSGAIAKKCMNDPATALGSRPLYSSLNSTVVDQLLFACGGCVLAAVDVETNPAVPNQTWVSPVDNCSLTAGGVAVGDLSQLVYQYSGNNLTALDRHTGVVQWNYKVPSGEAIANQPAVDTDGNVFVPHITASGNLKVQKLDGPRRSVDWTWNYSATNFSVIDAHVRWTDSNDIYVTLTTSFASNAHQSGSSVLCGLSARTGKQNWCSTVVSASRGTSAISRVSTQGSYVVIASAVSHHDSPFVSGTLTTYNTVTPVTPEPKSGIVLQNCTGQNCIHGCETLYPSTGCNAGNTPGTSVLYFCEGGNTLLYAQYFNSTSTCTGLPSSAEEYGVGVCHPGEENHGGIKVTHC